jgi:hypothetical protein
MSAGRGTQSVAPHTCYCFPTGGNLGQSDKDPSFARTNCSTPPLPHSLALLQTQFLSRLGINVGESVSMFDNDDEYDEVDNDDDDDNNDDNDGKYNEDIKCNDDNNDD